MFSWGVPAIRLRLQHGVRQRLPQKVDCLTLLIYDSGGNYVGMRTVTGPELQDETYRMQLDLEPGRYRFIAYGGMASRRTFVRIRTAGTGQRRETGRDDR
ncbi:MAG: FimB/Mfa2 family fimbrial subunit [Alistipes indistinctus]